MKEWRRPEIMGLNFRATKGNPGKGGNDQFVNDFDEFFDDHFGTRTGSFTPSGVATMESEGIKRQ